MRILKRFWACDKGATAIEYALIGGLIAIAIITGATSLGNSISSSFEATSNEVETALD